jgi:crotonobetainyl-CoA:carnitine CoA-transferase CaiB-like acyl-CoA transferase
LFAPVFLERTTAAWDEHLAAAGVPAAPVRERDDLFDDEQAWAEGLLARVVDEEVGDIVMTAPVVRLSDSPGEIRFPGRHLGADTREVLLELGLADGDIDALVADGAARCG